MSFVICDVARIIVVVFDDYILAYLC